MSVNTKLQRQVIRQFNDFVKGMGLPKDVRTNYLKNIKASKKPSGYFNRVVKREIEELKKDKTTSAHGIPTSMPKSLIDLKEFRKQLIEKDLWLDPLQVDRINKLRDSLLKNKLTKQMWNEALTFLTTFDHSTKLAFRKAEYEYFKSTGPSKRSLEDWLKSNSGYQYSDIQELAATQMKTHGRDNWSDACDILIDKYESYITKGFYSEESHEELSKQLEIELKEQLWET